MNGDACQCAGEPERSPREEALADGRCHGLEREHLERCETKPIAALLVLLLSVVLVYSHQRLYASGTPVSRLDLLHALYEDSSVIIDIHGGNTSDKAVFGSHFFSDKAPGTVVLAFPAFAAAAKGLKFLGVALDSPKGWLTSSWAACAGSVSILTALGGAALCVWMSRRVPARAALVTTLALFLGAAPLPYATLLFSHSMVVGLIAIALWAMEKQKDLREERTADRANAECGARSSECGVREWLTVNQWDLLAGLCCGWALASEYTAGLVVVGLFIWLVSSGWRRAVPFCVAAIPPLLLVPAYSYACFHNPFILPYSLQASFPEMKQGLYAIKWPNPEIAYNLLFPPTRGLFFWSPFLVMAGVGYWKLIQSNPRLFWFTYAIPLLQIIVISGRAWDWQAGFTLGPRYLAPILPLLALPCALGVQRFPKLGIALAAYSILITTLATLTDACPDYSIYNPLTELHIPLFLKGVFSPNLGMVLGLPPYASVALYYAILVGGIGWLWRQLPAAEKQNPTTEGPGLKP